MSLPRPSRSAFRPLEETAVVVFELSENVSVQKVLDAAGWSWNSARTKWDPACLPCAFPSPFPPTAATRSRSNTPGASIGTVTAASTRAMKRSAYIGPEGTYLLYASKWFPAAEFLSDRATGHRRSHGAARDDASSGRDRNCPWSPRASRKPSPGPPNQPDPAQLDRRRTILREEVPGGLRSPSTVSPVRRTLGSIQRSAEAVGRMLEYFRKLFGESASRTSIRLVEVDDRLSVPPRHCWAPSSLRTASWPSNGRPCARSRGARRTSGGVKPSASQSAEDLWLVGGLDYFSAALYAGEVGGAEGFKQRNGRAGRPRAEIRRTRAPSAEASASATDANPTSRLWPGRVPGLSTCCAACSVTEFRRAPAAVREESIGERGEHALALRNWRRRYHGKELGWFFSEWLDSIGVPNLQTDYVDLTRAQADSGSPARSSRTATCFACRWMSKC